MVHYEAKMSSKGQVTVPAPVREALDLKTGDTVDFYLDKRARLVRLRARNRPVSELFGALNKYIAAGTSALTQEDIDGAVGDHLADEDVRIMREYAEWQAFREWRRTQRAAAAE